jgi:hypothetical protein
MSNEVQLASEEVNRRNVRAAVDYSKETRKLLRDTEAHVEQLKGMVQQYKTELDQLRSQVTMLLVEKYNRKPTE